MTSIPPSSPQNLLARSNASITLGGFTGFLPDEWQQKLEEEIERRSASAPLGLDLEQARTAWHSNDCIFTALSKNLFHQFGILLPDESIFMLYNSSGDGVPPQQIHEAISSIVEQVGVVIDRIIVSDPDLRAAVGEAPQVAGPEAAAQMNGKPGICMINIGPGYSHAFYWDCMDARAAAAPEFRMAVMLRRIDSQAASKSVLHSLSDYRELFRSTISRMGPTADGDRSSVAAAYFHLDELLRFASNQDNRNEADYRRQLVSLIEKAAVPIEDLLGGQTSRDARAVLHAPVLLRQIVLDSSSIN